MYSTLTSMCYRMGEAKVVVSIPEYVCSRYFGSRFLLFLIKDRRRPTGGFVGAEEPEEEGCLSYLSCSVLSDLSLCSWLTLKDSWSTTYVHGPINLRDHGLWAQAFLFFSFFSSSASCILTLAPACAEYIVASRLSPRWDGRKGRSMNICETERQQSSYPQDEELRRHSIWPIMREATEGSEIDSCKRNRERSWENKKEGWKRKPFCQPSR